MRLSIPEQNNRTPDRAIAAENKLRECRDELNIVHSHLQAVQDKLERRKQMSNIHVPAAYCSCCKEHTDQPPEGPAVVCSTCNKACNCYGCVTEEALIDKDKE